MYIIIATGLAMVLMVVGLIFGVILQTAFGVESVSTSPAILGGLTVGISVAFIGAGVLAAWGTIKVAPSEANRVKFFSTTSRTLGRPLAEDLGYVENDDKNDEDAEDWYTRARDRNREDDFTVLG